MLMPDLIKVAPAPLQRPASPRVFNSSMVMPIAEGLVEGDGLEGGGVVNDGAGPALA